MIAEETWQIDIKHVSFESMISWLSANRKMITDDRALKTASKS